MPIKEFSCKNCDSVYEDLVKHDEKGKYPGVLCPECGSEEKTPLMSSCKCNFTNPVNSDRWNSESTGHDYRFKHNLPNVIKQRQAAEQQSHMGTDPYPNKDDISSGKYFSEVQ